MGEGPVWLESTNSVLWVDIPGRCALVSSFQSGATRRFAAPAMIGAIVPRRSGGFLAAGSDGVCAVDSEFRSWETVCHPESHLPNRFNDGKCDPAGRFWVGSVDVEERVRRGTLYVVHKDLRCEAVLDGLMLANGLDWSPDGSTFYLTDSFDRIIWAFDYDVHRCALSNRRVFSSIPVSEGVADGLCVDADGYVWSARWDGGMVVRYAPDGTISETYSLPVSRPTSCTFGGPQLKTLLVTSASIGLAAGKSGEPLAGSLFAVDVDRRGQPSRYFEG